MREEATGRSMGGLSLTVVASVLLEAKHASDLERSEANKLKMAIAISSGGRPIQHVACGLCGGNVSIGHTHTADKRRCCRFVRLFSKLKIYFSFFWKYKRARSTDRRRRAGSILVFTNHERAHVMR